MDKAEVLHFIKGLAIGALALIFGTALGLGFIHVSDFPYTRDIEALDILETSGLSREEIMDNYRAVTGFLSPFSSREFDLPTMKYSETGASHFYDCKVIFGAVYLFGAVSGLALLLIFVVKRRLDSKTLGVASGVTVFIPLAFTAALLINFDLFFNLFHALLFEGDTWLFDPSIDEIINILPAGFFMHCALVIAFFWLAASAVLGFSSFSARKKSRRL